jgi:leader peptidase (prepilin peptidase)/N-methyltransferase
MTVVLVEPRDGARRGVVAIASAVGVVALGATAITGRLGWSSAIVAAWALLSVVAALVDSRTERLPDRLVLPGVAITVVGGLMVGRLPSVIAGALLFGVPLLVVHLAHPDGMGFGDVKFASMLGAGIGLVAVPLVLPAYLLAAVLHVVICVAARAGRRPVPFGPSLALGSIAVLVVALVGR